MITSQAQARTVLADLGDVYVDLFDATLTANKVAAERAALNEKTAGVYTTFTALAIDCEDSESFAEIIEAYFDLVRTNHEGLAVVAKCDPAKKEGTFKVPSSMSAAKSVMLGAFEHGIDLQGEDGPRAYTAIAKDVRAANALKKQGEMSDNEKLVAEIQAKLALLAEKAPEQGGTTTLLIEMLEQVDNLGASWGLEIAGKIEKAA